MGKTLINEFVDIPYSPETFKSKKYEKLRQTMLSLFITNIEIEGSIRGGKDVTALLCWSEYLMLTPDKLHLVTGTSENHAIENVLNADGFGIKYLLPHGELAKDNNKIKYKFKDFFGIDKEIHFFGNSKIDDEAAYRGISYGSHYGVEATKQNVHGLQVAAGRTSAAKWRKIIHTQNPVSPASDYYLSIEKPLCASEPKAIEIQNIKEKYAISYGQICAKYERIIKEKIEFEGKKYLKRNKAYNYEKLNDKQKRRYRALLIRTKIDVILERENELFNKYKINSAYYEFEPYYDNVNEVRNGIFFRYFHYNMQDNPTISSARFNEICSTYDPHSIIYQRDILGKRAIANNAIYSNLKEDNFYNEDLPDNLKKYGWFRFIYIDYGVVNDYVMLDCYIDPNTYTLFVENESRFKTADDELHRSPNEKFYGELLIQLINSRENGEYDGVGVDPSARGYINYLNSIGIYTKRSKNSVSRNKKEKSLDAFNKDKPLDNSINGIELVKLGFELHKIYINNKCKKLRQELEGYVLDDKKLLIGIEVPLKIKDHGCDALRYFVNTEIGKPSIWQINENKEIDIFDEIKRIREYETQKES